MSVLVTGGAGFVGSHVVDRLRADGRGVVALDDLSSGSLRNLAVHPETSGFTFVRGDVRDAALVDRLVSASEAVLHLAGAVGVRRVADDPAGTWSRNVEGTAAVLAACARRRVPCLFASTSEVYGAAATGVLEEDASVVLDPAARREVYSISKLAGESLALALRRSDGLRVVVARLFNVVGPRQCDRYGMVLPRFARAAVRGEPLVVHGDGRQTRCFLHAADAAEALLALLACDEADGKVVNVGGDEEVAILDLARAVVAAAGGDAPIRHVPFESVYGAGFVDPPRRRPSLVRLRALTGLSPRRRLSDAVADVVRSVGASSGSVPAR